MVRHALITVSLLATFNLSTQFQAQASGPIPSPQSIGGEQVDDAHAVEVRPLFPRVGRCSGSLVRLSGTGRFFVLTAMHCLVDINNFSHKQVTQPGQIKITHIKTKVNLRVLDVMVPHLGISTRLSGPVGPDLALIAVDPGTKVMPYYYSAPWYPNYKSCQELKGVKKSRRKYSFRSSAQHSDNHHHTIETFTQIKDFVLNQVKQIKSTTAFSETAGAPIMVASRFQYHCEIHNLASRQSLENALKLVRRRPSLNRIEDTQLHLRMIAKWVKKCRKFLPILVRDIPWVENDRVRSTVKKVADTTANFLSSISRRHNLEYQSVYNLKLSTRDLLRDAGKKFESVPNFIQSKLNWAYPSEYQYVFKARGKNPTVTEGGSGGPLKIMHNGSEFVVGVASLSRSHKKLMDRVFTVPPVPLKSTNKRYERYLDDIYAIIPNIPDSAPKPWLDYRARLQAMVDLSYSKTMNVEAMKKRLSKESKEAYAAYADLSGILQESRSFSTICEASLWSTPNLLGWVRPHDPKVWQDIQIRLSAKASAAGR